MVVVPALLCTLFHNLLGSINCQIRAIIDRKLKNKYYETKNIGLVKTNNIKKNIQSSKPLKDDI